MRLIAWLVLFASVLAFAPAAGADELASAAAVKLLPNRIGGFVAVGAPRPAVRFSSGDFNETGEVTREYRLTTGERLLITLVTTKSDSSAYALLANRASRYPRLAEEVGADPQILKSDTVGTVSYLFRDCLFFYKGRVYVSVTQIAEQGKHLDQILPLARAFADSLDKGEGELPALVKHLPESPSPQNVGYAVNANSLERLVSDQPVLQSIGFDGGTEVVAANYGSSQLVIAEFTTPQLAVDNDWNIRVKIRELSSEGKPAPTAYRRVGNYAVFVFKAPNERTANQLIDQVKYEQVVQWLGDNPYWLRDVQRRYTETMLGTFVSVVKASGLAAVLCFGVGGFFGALLFTRRRAQQAAQRAYSDAGGMMRLNIDKLSAETDTQRLLGPGKP